MVDHPILRRATRGRRGSGAHIDRNSSQEVEPRIDFRQRVSDVVPETLPSHAWGGTAAKGDSGGSQTMCAPHKHKTRKTSTTMLVVHDNLGAAIITDRAGRTRSAVHIRPFSCGFSIPDIGRGEREPALRAAGALYRVVALVFGFCGRVVFETDDGERAVFRAGCHRTTASTCGR